jgi:hypothetical protein
VNSRRIGSIFEPAPRILYDSTVTQIASYFDEHYMMVSTAVLAAEGGL